MKSRIVLLCLGFCMALFSCNDESETKYNYCLKGDFSFKNSCAVDTASLFESNRKPSVKLSCELVISKDSSIQVNIGSFPYDTTATSYFVCIELDKKLDSNAYFSVVKIDFNCPKYACPLDSLGDCIGSFNETIRQHKIKSDTSIQNIHLRCDCP